MSGRKHPPVAVGHTFGPYTVTRLLPRGYRGRSDERVVWRCTCGRVGISFVFNLRKAKESCTHEDEKGLPTQHARGLLTRLGVRGRE